MAATDGYMLSRDQAEFERQVKHQRIFADCFGYYIHPSIKERLDDNCRIADMATGTGVWLREIAKELSPDCKLDGFDSSKDLWTQDLPGNISFIHHDLRQPFNVAFHGRYDLVHIKLLWTAVSRDEYMTILRNCIQLLKPGGSIQAVEPSPMTSKFYRSANFVQPTALYNLGWRFVDRMAERGKFKPSFMVHIFQEEGLTDIVDDIMSPERDAQMRHDFTVSVFTMVLQYFQFIKEDVQDLFEAAIEEADAGAYIRQDLHTIVGRKLTEDERIEIRKRSSISLSDSRSPSV